MTDDERNVNDAVEPPPAKANDSERPTLRGPDGRFLPGTAPGPGRTPGIDLVHVCREAAAVEAVVDGGETLELRVWRVVRRLLDDAVGGNLKAAELVLRHLVQPLDDKPAVDARTVLIGAAGVVPLPGPPEPARVEFARYLGRLAEASEQVLGEAERVEAAEAVEVAPEQHDGEAEAQEPDRRPVRLTDRGESYSEACHREGIELARKLDREAEREARIHRHQAP